MRTTTISVPVGSLGLDFFPGVATHVLEDFALRRLGEIIATHASLSRVSVFTPGQFVHARSCIRITGSTISADITIEDDSLTNAEWELIVNRCGLEELVKRWGEVCQEQKSLLFATAAIVNDAATVRQWVAENGGVAFISNGSILARDGNASDPDSPLTTAGRSIPFTSPPSLQCKVPLGQGRTVQGLLIPRGVTVIFGGGFHGKSTLLRALSWGAYDKIPGDGRELCVTVGTSSAVRSEDGRSVGAVDISPFINNLPPSCGIDVGCFSTSSASGSTSQAASVMECLEIGTSLLLLDEDTCAGNFMVRDSRLRSLIANEPITPFIYRVNSLHKQLGVSSIVVVGGSGDWFDVQDTSLQLDDYSVMDVTRRALQISKTFCTGRVEYNGRGLVHQLPWTHSLQVPERYFNVSQLALELPLSDGAVRASEDGHWLFYSCLSLDLSKIEQRLPTREAQAGALGVAAALLFLAKAFGGYRCEECWVSVSQAFSCYSTELTVSGGVSGNSWDEVREVLGHRPFVLPLPFILAASINRMRGIKFRNIHD